MMVVLLAPVEIPVLQSRERERPFLGLQRREQILGMNDLNGATQLAAHGTRNPGTDTWFVLPLFNIHL